jgi:hypothetical protein
LFCAINHAQPFGDPDGKPALVVQGGPRSGCGTGSRRYFDPDRCRVDACAGDD